MSSNTRETPRGVGHHQKKFVKHQGTSKKICETLGKIKKTLGDVKKTLGNDVGWLENIGKMTRDVKQHKKKPIAHSIGKPLDNVEKMVEDDKKSPNQKKIW